MNETPELRTDRARGDIDWTAEHDFFYPIAGRLGRTDKGVMVELGRYGLHVMDHLGIVVTVMWEDVTSIGMVRPPSAGAGLAEAAVPLPQPDQPATGIGASHGLICWGDQMHTERLPRRARRPLADQPFDTDRAMSQIGIAFLMAGRVDQENEIVKAARKHRPDLFADRSIREAR